MSFKYGNRISLYKYDEGAKEYNCHMTLLSEDPILDDEIRIDLENPAFDKIYKYVKIFNKNKEFYTERFYEEMYCEIKTITNEQVSPDERLDSKKNLLNLRALCRILKTEYGFDLKSNQDKK